MQLTTVQLGGAIIVFLGHCPPDPARVRAERRALERDPDLLMTWPGAYACLMVRSDRLRVYTDLAAQFAVYYSRLGARTIVGSDPRTLAALHRRRPDALTAAVRISCPDVLPLWESRSPFEHVARVPGGCSGSGNVGNH